MIECDKESLGFKSKNCEAQFKELEAFEEDLLDIIKVIKFRNIYNKFKNFYYYYLVKLSLFSDKNLIVFIT